MSNQQGMYYPQDQEPREQESQRAANTDPREQPGQQHWQEPVAEAYSGYERGYADYGEGYGGTRSHEQEKVRPQQQPVSGTGIQPKHIIFAIIAIVILSSIFSALERSGIFSFLTSLALLALIGYFFIYRQSATVAIQPQLFTVQGQARLVIKNPAGSIKITRAQGNTVEIRGQQRVGSVFGSTWNTRLRAEQNDNTISVSAAQTSWRPSQIDLEITAPPGCDVQIDGNAGMVDIDGLDGEAVVETNAGTINVRNAVLRGRSRLKTNAGTVDFSGTLDPQANCRMESNLGTITATIAADTSFVVEAKTDVGSVTNQFGSNIVGMAPYGRLELYTNVGSIDVRRG